MSPTLVVDTDRLADEIAELVRQAHELGMVNIKDAPAVVLAAIDAADAEAMMAGLIGQENRGVASVSGKCPDGGACHHGCEGSCWRVSWCGPLSGVFPGDRWPAGLRGTS
jgi:hypothetical protein